MDSSVKKALLVTLISFILFALSFADGKPNTELDKNMMVEKALAENAIFRCSVNNTLASRYTGAKLDQELQIKCAEPIAGLSKWYKKEDQKQKRALRLLSNGKRSALANKGYL